MPSDMIPVALRKARFGVIPSPNAPFWLNMAGGTWEPETFQVLDRCITEDTTVLDVGAWIGPTALYSAHQARMVYAFEPDPAAFRELEANVAANRHLPIEIIHAAVAETHGIVSMGANEAGDSGSSILRAGRPGTWSIPAIRLDRFVQERDIREPLFIKMDIEGYEYALIPHLLPALKGRRFILYLSTHPHILWDSIRASSQIERIKRRSAMIRNQGHLLRVLYTFPVVLDSQFQPLRLRDVLPALFRGKAFTRDRSVIVASHSLP